MTSSLTGELLTALFMCTSVEADAMLFLLMSLQQVGLSEGLTTLFTAKYWVYCQQL